MGIKKIINISYIGVLFMLAPAVHAGLISIGGDFMGADGIDINGTIYNVELREGSCKDVFGSCDNSDFMFTSAADAMDASAALLDIIDGTIYDLDPSKSYGDSSAGQALISYLTAYSTDGIVVELGVADNGTDEAMDLVRRDIMDVDYSTLGDVFGVWAVWSKAGQSTSIPEPSPLLLLGIGLVALQIGSRRTA